jgi:hypothetical protein
MTRIVEQGYEAKLDIEVPGRVIDGVDFDRPDADLVGQELDTSQGIEQEKGAQATALSAAIHGEPSNCCLYLWAAALSAAFGSAGWSSNATRRSQSRGVRTVTPR